MDYMPASFGKNYEYPAGATVGPLKLLRRNDVTFLELIFYPDKGGLYFHGAVHRVLRIYDPPPALGIIMGLSKRECLNQFRYRSMR